MRGDEILRIIGRITRDFAPLFPGLRLEVVSPEGFKARVRGKPIIADEAALREVLVEEAARTREKTREKTEDPILPKRKGRKGEGGEEKKVPEVISLKGAAARYPLYALPSSRTIMVDMESLTERVNREDRRLQRPLVEGMILREVIYLATSLQPSPDPRARAETILRRHWPFQYAAMRSVGLTVTGFEKPPGERVLGRDN